MQKSKLIMEKFFFLEVQVKMGTPQQLTEENPLRNP